jgi:hypothetical protein
LKRSENLPAVGEVSPEERRTLLRQILKRLKSGGRFDPGQCLSMTWDALESEMLGLSE